MAWIWGGRGLEGPTIFCLRFTGASAGRPVRSSISCVGRASAVESVLGEGPRRPFRQLFGGHPLRHEGHTASLRSGACGARWTSIFFLRSEQGTYEVVSAAWGVGPPLRAFAGRGREGHFGRPSAGISCATRGTLHRSVGDFAVRFGPRPFFCAWSKTCTKAGTWFGLVWCIFTLQTQWKRLFLILQLYS